VENALYHGLEDKRGHGELKISGGLSENLISLKVSDNGLGAAKEQVDEINKLLSQSPKITDLGRRDKQSIGIKNIHSRIQLYYGIDYGLTFESRENVGTTVIIRVPRL
jgi:two-component system, sensor histidine kinase YesM